MSEVISSHHNRRIKELARLAASRGRRRGGLAIIEGPCAITAALESGVSPSLVCHRADADPELVRELAARGAEVLTVTARVLDRISDTETSQGLLVVALTDEPRDAEEWWRRSTNSGPGGTSLVVLGDGIQDPGNVGTLVRSAAGVGAGGLAFSAGADPYSPKALRAAAGWTFSLPVASLPLGDCLTVVRASGLALVAAVPGGGQAPWLLDLKRPLALLLGSESRGLSPEALRQADAAVTIPLFGAESFNVAIAGSILLYEAARQRLGSGGDPSDARHHPGGR